MRSLNRGVQPPQAPVFWDNIVKEPAKHDPGEHWVWIGPTMSLNPIFRTEGRVLSARRLAWEKRHGKLTTRRLVLSDCSLPLCVNPAHLRIRA